MDSIALKIKEEFNISDFVAQNTIKLIDDGNTIPFIARYRKEMTGSLDDQVLRELYDRLNYLRSTEERRSEVRRLICAQGNLTDEIEAAISRAQTLQELDDIYRPFRPKRRTRATVAKEAGLAPLADMLFLQNIYKGDIADIAKPFINPEKEINTIEDALKGAMDVIAEKVADNPEYRKAVRSITFRNGRMTSKVTKDEESVYKMYNDFAEPLQKVANHRVLAMNRGESEGILKVSIDIDEQVIIDYLKDKTVSKQRAITSQYVADATADAYLRLIAPSIATEIRNSLTERAGESAIKLFSKNLNNLLMQPPVRGAVVMGFDPAFRTGNKTAVIDATGKVLATTVLYCTLENHDKEKAKQQVLALIDKYKIDVIAIGNGTASKESEIFIAQTIKSAAKEVKYIMVNESGASVYSASPLAAEEFPEYDVSLRSAASIARRLQDPLTELVKIDPQAIGVGQYQHDMNQKRLGEALAGVVEGCVNNVGVDLNTASPSLLSYVAGINMGLAKSIFAYKEKNIKFKNRKELLAVPKLGKKAFEQCAGFLTIPDGDNVLDNTMVHPESYAVTKKLLTKLKYTFEDIKKGGLADIDDRLRQFDKQELLKELGVLPITFNDIVAAISKPRRDPREELPAPNLRSDILGMEDLAEGMVLTGTVRNVIDFGAFVDIGVHQDGLVHISEIGDSYIKHPTEALSVGDIVKVKVLSIDVKRSRIALSMRNM